MATHQDGSSHLGLQSLSAERSGRHICCTPSIPSHNAFAGLYFSDAALNIGKELVGFACKRKRQYVRGELFNLSGQLEDEDFELKRHPDSARPNVDPIEEQQLLEEESPEAASHMPNTRSHHVKTTL